MGRFNRQLKQVAITYLTHRWIMAIIVAYSVVVVAPQLAVGVAAGQSDEPAGTLIAAATFAVVMPLFFLSLMLVPQAKAQFAHWRSRLIPGFAGPHVLTLGLLLLAMVILYPLGVATCCRFDPLGMTSMATAIAATTILGLHFTRGWGIFVAMAVFYSTFVPAAAQWWLFPTESHRPVHAAILLGGVGLLACWLRRLSVLHEQMEDYLTTVTWKWSRRAGSEVPEQRRIVAEQYRRNRVGSWATDIWLARLPRDHHGRFGRLARLLRYGFGQPAELQAVLMAGPFFAASLFLSVVGRDSDNGPLFYLQMAIMFPGMIASESLARRRPRIGAELFYPLPRRRLVDGLLLAATWNALVVWLVMGVGLVLLLLWSAEQFTVVTALTVPLVAGSATLAMIGVALRTAVCTSNIKRLAAMLGAFLALSVAVFAWWYAWDGFGNQSGFVAATVGLVTVLSGIAAVFIELARRAWRRVELG